MEKIITTCGVTSSAGRFFCLKRQIHARRAERRKFPKKNSCNSSKAVL